MTTPYAFGVRLRVDPFVIALLTTVGVAFRIPAQSGCLPGLTLIAKIGVGILFFIYGARSSTRQAMSGLRHWQLHLAILATTYATFSGLGTALNLIPDPISSTELADGVLVVLCASVGKT